MDGHATNQAADAAAKLPKALADFKEHMKQPAAAGEPLNTFHLTFTSEDTIDDADKFAKRLGEAQRWEAKLAKQRAELDGK